MYMVHQKKRHEVVVLFYKKCLADCDRRRNKNMNGTIHVSI